MTKRPCLDDLRDIECSSWFSFLEYQCISDLIPLRTILLLLLTCKLLTILSTALLATSTLSGRAILLSILTMYKYYTQCYGYGGLSQGIPSGKVLGSNNINFSLQGLGNDDENQL